MPDKEIALIAAPVLIVSVIVLVIARSYYKNHFGGGYTKAVFFTGKHLVTGTGIFHAGSGGGVSSSKGYWNTRLLIIDAESRKVTGKKILQGDRDLLMVINNILWTVPESLRYPQRARQEITGTSLLTLETACTEKDIRQSCGIPGGDKTNQLLVSTGSGKITLTTDSGFKHEFDCAGLSAGTAGGGIVLPVPSDPVKLQLLGNFKFSQIQDAERYQVFFKGSAIAAGQSFIGPECIYASFAADGPENLVFTHRTSLGKNAGYFIACAGANGNFSQQELPLKAESNAAPELIYAGKSEELLFLASKNAKRNRLFGIAKKDGRIVFMENL